MNAPLPSRALPFPKGKQRLIDAALRVAARDGTALSSLGLRELAREAGLNHNTFYRHFKDLTDLGRAAADEVVGPLMAAMKEIRRGAAQHQDPNVGAADYFLDFARKHPELIVVGLRELHTSDSPMRAALRRAIGEIAQESAEQMLGMDLAGGMTRETLLPATSAITYYMFYRALDYLERPRDRRQVRDDIVSFIRSQFLGRRALSRSRTPN